MIIPPKSHQLIHNSKLKSHDFKNEQRFPPKQETHVPLLSSSRCQSYASCRSVMCRSVIVMNFAGHEFRDNLVPSALVFYGVARRARAIHVH